MIRGKVAKYLPVYKADPRLRRKAFRGEKLYDMSTKDRVQLAAILRNKTKWSNLFNA